MDTFCDHLLLSVYYYRPGNNYAAHVHVSITADQRIYVRHVEIQKLEQDIKPDILQDVKMTSRLCSVHILKPNS